MKNIFSYNRYSFVEYRYSKYRYTDSRSGALMHFLAVMLEGHCRIVAEDLEITVQAGEAFYIPMGLPYQSYWYGKPGIRFLSYGFGYFPSNCDYRLQKLPRGAAEIIGTIPLCDEPDAAALGNMYTVLGMLVPQMEQAELAPSDRLVSMATACMRKDAALSMAEVARLCFVSESTLYAAFRKTGATPNDIRQKLVIDKAVKLLTPTEASVQQISDQLGFSSTDYFRRILRKHTGMNPREIRSGARTV